VSDGRGLLLSLKPRFAASILDGTKTVELRRTLPRVSAGARVVLYSSSPRREIVGHAVVDAVESAAPAHLWEAVGDRSAVTRAEFDEYFHNSHLAVALHLREVQAVPVPVPLSALRSAGLEPPQSWRYVDDRQCRALVGSPRSAPGAACDEPALASWPDPSGRVANTEDESARAGLLGVVARTIRQLAFQWR
jgi:predicted transcriptional regulator